jgi:hypothetical protein
MAQSYWMFVESPANYEISEKMGLTVCGLARSYRRRAERMQPNDRVLFYISGIRKWAASATVASRSYIDETPVWNSNRTDEVYPYRVKLNSAIVLRREDYIDAMVLGPRLEYVKRWAPEEWPLAFLDRLHLIPQRDFRLIEAEMKRIVSKGRRRPGRNQGRRRGDHRARGPVQPPVQVAPDPSEQPTTPGSLSSPEIGEAAGPPPESTGGAESPPPSTGETESL